MSKFLLLLAVATFCVYGFANSQVIATINNGLWNDPATWSGGIIPLVNNCTGVEVRHNVTLANSTLVSALTVSGNLVIDTGGVLEVIQRNGSGSLSITGAGTTVVKGILIGHDSVTYSTNASNLTILTGATFRMAGGSKCNIPLASWNPNSHFHINGFVGSGYINISFSTGWKQRFGNVIYDCPLQNGFVDLNGYLKDVAGDFIIKNTNGQALRLSTTQRPDIRIEGNLIVQGNSEVWFTTTSDSAKVTIQKNFEYRSTSTGPSYFTTRGRCFVTTLGNFLVDSNGPLRICSGSVDSTGVRRSTLVINNGLDIRRGSFISPPPGKGTIIFAGSSLQTLNTNASTFSGNFDFHVYSVATVDIGQSVLSNTTGNLFIKGHVKLGSSDAGGALQLNAGNIQTKGSRFFYPDCTIEYNGNALQRIGSGHPLNKNVNVICNNPQGVELLQSLVTKNLSIASGALSTKGFLLAISGDVVVLNSSAIDKASFFLNGSANQNVNFNGSTLNVLTINKPSGTRVKLVSPLNIASLLSVQSTGTIIESNGMLTLISAGDVAGKSASVATIPSGSGITGQVTVQRFMPAEGRIFRYIASPVVSATVEDLKDDFSVTGTFTDPSNLSGANRRWPSLYYYNAGSAGLYGWNACPSLGVAADYVLAPGTGYAAYIWEGGRDVIWDVTGELNQGRLELPLAYNSRQVEYKGWNLIGNPFASAIDWSAPNGWEKSDSISAVFAIRDNGLGTFHYSDGDIGDLDEPFISAGQAFWVHLTGKSSLAINEYAKVGGDADFFRKPGKTEVNYVKLSILGSTAKDQTFLRLRDKSFPSYDLYDAPKMNNDELSFSFLTSDSIAVAISAMESFSCYEVFPLKLDVSRKKDGTIVDHLPGVYTIDLQRFGLTEYSEFSLLDRFSNDTLLFDQPIKITITSERESYSPYRFSLIMETPSPIRPTLRYNEKLCPHENLQIDVVQNGTFARFYISVDSQQYFFQNNQVVIPRDSLNKSGQLLLIGENVCGQLVETLIIKKFKDIPVSEVESIKACVRDEVVVTMKDKNLEYHWFDDELLTSELAASGPMATFNVKKSKTIYGVAVDKNSCRSRKTPIFLPRPQIDSLYIICDGNGLTLSSGKGDWFFEGENVANSVKGIPIRGNGMYTVVSQIGQCEKTARYDLDDITIYPIPFEKELFVKADGVSPIILIEIYDQQGRKIKDYVVNDFTVRLNTEDFSEGLHIMTVNTNKKTKIVRIVKR